MKAPALSFVLGITGALFGACAASHSTGVSPGEGLDASRPEGGSSGIGYLTPSDSSLPPTRSCSSDLHNVIDAAGNVVQQCTPDEACSAGACLAACTAAAANHDNVACDFMPAAPSFYAAATGSPCWAVFVTNNWTTPATINVTYQGTNYDVSTFGRVATAGVPESSWPAVPASGLAPGQVAVLFLSHAAAATPASDYACPIPAALEQGTAVLGTGRGQAWHIVTSAPVSLYDILPYGGASSILPGASLLLPTTAWGTNYIGVVPKLGDPHKSPGPQWAQIVAASDSTTVQIVPTVALPSGTNVSAAPQNQVTTYTLNSGEFVQWENPYVAGQPGAIAGAQAMEMSGSVISSDKPIAVQMGNGFLCLTSATSTGGGCDSDHEQIPPVSALGSDYAPAPYATRRSDLQPESIPYRIVGVVDGTQLTYDPVISGTPATLDQGAWADFESTTAFAVHSQDSAHPFYLGQMMSGCEVTGGSRTADGCLGDEDYVNVMPAAQFLRSYLFFTDLTYPTTTLTFVRNRTASGFADVQLDCLGAITGWQPVDAAGMHEWTTVDLVRGDAGAGTCRNGPHAATSSGPFGLTVWGLAYAASYSYPAGTNVAPINAVYVPPTPR